MSTGNLYGRVRAKYGVGPGGVRYEYGSTGPYIGPYPYSVLLGTVERLRGQTLPQARPGIARV